MFGRSWLRTEPSSGSLKLNSTDTFTEFKKSGFSYNKIQKIVSVFFFCNTLVFSLTDFVLFIYKTYLLFQVNFRNKLYVYVYEK